MNYTIAVKTSQTIMTVMIPFSGREIIYSDAKEFQENYEKDFLDEIADYIDFNKKMPRDHEIKEITEQFGVGLDFLKVKVNLWELEEMTNVKLMPKTLGVFNNFKNNMKDKTNSFANKLNSVLTRDKDLSDMTTTERVVMLVGIVIAFVIFIILINLVKGLLT